MVEHFEVLVEEPSMEAFLRQVLPRLIADRASFEIYPFQGKHDLLGRLDERLRGYAPWLPASWRIVVVIDRDDDDCHDLKERLEACAAKAGLATPRNRADRPQQAVFRMAIEELEAWYFAEWTAVRAAFPSLPVTVKAKAAYRYADAIAGGTWEAFERELQRHGYFAGGLRKIEAARRIGSSFSADRCTSPSFQTLRATLTEAPR